jgi:hypothetical protein
VVTIYTTHLKEISVVLYTQCIYMFGKILTIKGDYLWNVHLQTRLCNGEPVLSVRYELNICKCNSDEYQTHLLPSTCCKVLLVTASTCFGHRKAYSFMVYTWTV